jgi:heavy metal translocating P-type ATPase
MWQRVLAPAALAALAAGAVLHAAGRPGAGSAVWAASTALILVPLVASVLRALVRRDVGVDAIALVAIATALALGEYLAGSVVALMLAGGNALEEYATRRAARELTRLLERMPRIAHVRRNSVIEEVPVDAVRPGDIVVIRAGEVVPVDGLVLSSSAAIDESALTGEPFPVTYARDGTVRSGSANAGDAFELRAVRPAAESAYAGIVELVRHAETERAPFVRLADRYAAGFLPLALAVAGGAWALAGDPTRFLAVMVVATPCPLILAAPIAFIAGVSRAARSGVIVKSGGVIERLGEARSVLLDKTGTVTLGLPAVEHVVALDGFGPDELLRLAASVDQLSAHVLAEALVHDVEARGVILTAPNGVEEGRGQGVEGTVGARRVAVGSSSWLRERGYSGVAEASRRLDREPERGTARILVGVDGAVAGAIVMGDHLRDDAHRLVELLRKEGIRHVAIVTGDREAAATAVGEMLGVDRVYAEQSPEDKLEIVRALRAQPELQPVVMVGDGVNDAPALALADVGIAMGSVGSTVSSDTADAVVVLDRVDRIVDAVQIGRRSLGIARQSVIVGLALSVVAMGFAAAGFLAPVPGALLQEVIDVAVIANALRALR